MKLDEAEIVHGKKFERVSITLMNRALDPDIQNDHEKYFSVQSEQEIWPVANFQVEKESYDVLSWVFAQTKFPAVITAQSNGQKLQVPRVGEFLVEWHLAADMKTIKCMYGLQTGPTSAMNCIYCEQKRIKPTVGTASQANVAIRARGKAKWVGGLFATNVAEEPFDMNASARWKPILPIPLSRVHICTLHAQVRLAEKILHMHIMFVWNIQDQNLRATAINQMEKSLSTLGAHGGNVEIKRDPKRSGNIGNVPQKPSLSGVVASRLFKPSVWSGNDKAWKDICQAENNNIGNGADRIAKASMWRAFEEVQPYFTGLLLTAEERQLFKQKIRNFGNAYLKAFGEEHVTHYMVFSLFLLQNFSL
jgi:hypothetical protein